MPSQKRRERVKKLIAIGMTPLDAERQVRKIEKKEQEAAQKKAVKQR